MRQTRDMLAWVVGLGWLANLIAGMVPPLGYEPSLAVNAPMMLILGALYASGKKDQDNG